MADIIRQTIPGTFILATSAMLIALLIGISVGVLSALRKDSFFDRSALVVAVIGMSAPSFYMAIIISWLGGFLWYEHIRLPMIPIVLALLYTLVISLTHIRSLKWPQILKRLLLGLIYGWLVYGLLRLTGWNLNWLQLNFNLTGTGLEQSGSLYEVDVFDGPYLELRNLILPMLTLGIRPLAIIIQLTRNAMLDELSKDYVRTAKAKGLSTYKVVAGHALRNALNPVVTAVSGWFASLLAGAVFIEFIFGWQGLGLRVYEALINEDFPVVIGSVIVISSIFVLINILVDILYGLIDPRVRLGKESH